MFCCGSDIAKRNHEASVMDAEGKPLLGSITIKNIQEGCEKLFSLFERLNIGKSDVISGMETAGHYWLSVYEHLAEQSYDVRGLLRFPVSVTRWVPSLSVRLEVAFAGFDVKVMQSGEFTGTKQKISKLGSPYLRRAIWLAAQRAVFCNPILSEYYQALKARGKHHLTAIGAASRKLRNIICAILRENKPYEATPPKARNTNQEDF